MVSVIVSTPNEWTFINNNNHFVVFWSVCSAFIRSAAQSTLMLSKRIADKSANCTSFRVGLHLNSVSHFQYLSERFGNLLILCASLIFFFDGSGGENHMHRAFSLLSQFSSFRFEQFGCINTTCCICSLFMHCCCPFTNICLLVMPYLLFVYGNCVKINTSTPMRCEQTIQSTFIPSNERE